MKSSPEFIALRLKRDEISSAKKIWPTELQEIEKKIESLAKETPSNSTSSSEIMTLSLKQIELLESFMKSKEYSDFIKETQSEIDQINEKMNALKPVELVHAEHDVSVLYKKIYTS